MIIQVIPLLIFLYGIRMMILRMRENQVRVKKVLAWIETSDEKIREELDKEKLRRNM